jgi:hypothetical protein
MRLAAPWLAALGCCCACGPPPHGPFFGDEKLLVVGVDPEAEANAVVRQLEQRGYYEVRRLRGSTFTALGFAPVKHDTGAGRVRVVTLRGISLALDSSEPTLLTKGRELRLLDFPYSDSRDVDRDGDPEIFVREEPLPTGEPCLRAYRVRATGVVEELSGDDFTLPRPPESKDPGWADVAFCGAVQAPPATPDPTTPAP